MRSKTPKLDLRLSPLKLEQTNPSQKRNRKPNKWQSLTKENNSKKGAPTKFNMLFLINTKSFRDYEFWIKNASILALENLINDKESGFAKNNQLNDEQKKALFKLAGEQFSFLRESINNSHKIGEFDKVADVLKKNWYHYTPELGDAAQNQCLEEIKSHPQKRYPALSNVLPCNQASIQGLIQEDPNGFVNLFNVGSQAQPPFSHTKPEKGLNLIPGDMEFHEQPQEHLDRFLGNADLPVHLTLAHAPSNSSNESDSDKLTNSLIDLLGLKDLEDLEGLEGLDLLLMDDEERKFN